MPNIGVVLKDEITRLAKKVLKTQVAPLQASAAAHRRHIAAMKRQISALEKEVARLRKAAPGRAPAAASDEDSGQPPLRFQAKGLRSLRARLGLSAEEFGKLAGVSGQSVYNWEAEKTVPRRAQLQSLSRLRSLGKREVRKMLDSASQA